MIIPPDPEKDPNAFDPSASTVSLLPPPSENDGVPFPERAHVTPADGYWHGDDLGVGFTGEALPPYEGRRSRLGADRGGDGLVDPGSPSLPPLQPTQQGAVPMSPASRPIDRRARTPYPPLPSTSLSPIASSSSSSTVIGSDAPSKPKFWESSSSPSRRQRRQLCGIPLIAPPSLVPAKHQKKWRRWRKWIFLCLLVLLIGLGAMTGVLLGIRTGDRRQSSLAAVGNDRYGNNGPYNGNHTGHATQWQLGQLNLTYTSPRDDPAPTDGTPIECNRFIRLASNRTDIIAMLPVSFPRTNLSIATFDFPISYNLSRVGLPSDFAITSQGLLSSGSLSFIGSDAPFQVIEGGKEGAVQVNVVFSGGLHINRTMRVCKMVRADGGLGVGIYTPTGIDDATNYNDNLNLSVVVAFNVFVRLPPSLVTHPGAPLYLPSLTMNVERMTVRFGNLLNVLDVGVWTIGIGSGS